MNSFTNIAELNVSMRRYFIESFMSEVISTIHRRRNFAVMEKEIENELLKEIAKQNQYMGVWSMEESRLITRQFGPSPFQDLQPSTFPILNQPATQTSQINTQIKTPSPTTKTEEVIEEIPLSLNEAIDPLLKQNIKTIEYSDGTIKIKRNGEFEYTNIQLNESEAQGIIKKIAEITKMPLTDNLLKTVIGKFTITAFLSNKIGSRFLIQRK